MRKQQSGAGLEMYHQTPEDHQADNATDSELDEAVRLLMEHEESELRHVFDYQTRTVNMGRKSINDSKRSSKVTL